MPNADWHIVRDYDRGRLMALYTVCGVCWPDCSHLYKAAPERGYRTDVRPFTPTPLDECHHCGQTPAGPPPQEDANALGRM